MSDRPGLLVLFGSGETSASGRRIFDWLLARHPEAPRIAVLETPAGFQPNSALVAGEIADFLRIRLQNYRPDVTVVPARKRGTPFSPDDPDIAAQVVPADLVFLGPGSPTYAVKQLRGSLVWEHVLAKHRLGADLVLASAATVAVGARALPVYEIYKVGEDLRWEPGLDVLRAYGLNVVLVPHWDNTDGGTDLDTSRCFMGEARFAELRAQLEPEATIVGIDEHTALIVDVAAAECQVLGRGKVTVIGPRESSEFASDQRFGLGWLGEPRQSDPGDGIRPDVWERVAAAGVSRDDRSTGPSPEVVELAKEREAARARRDWSSADAIRKRIADLGWSVADSPDGSQLKRA